MTDRSFKLYSGENQSPVEDLTDLVIWERAEFGARAHRGEATSSSVTLRDEQAEVGHGAADLPATLTQIRMQAHNVAEWIHGSNVLWRGRVATEDYTRGAQWADRAREVSLYLEDVNIDLRGVVVHNWVRPAETDVARIQGLVAEFLSGSPSATRNINGSNLVNAGSNTVSLPAKTYTRTSTDQVIADIAAAANKTYFLRPRQRTSDTHSAELFYDGNDAVMDVCPFKITDRVAEVEASPEYHFYPWWNVGPAASLNGQEIVTGVWLFYGMEEDEYVHVQNPVQRTLTAHWEEVLYDDEITTEAEATAKANAILTFRAHQERTINVTIGPLADHQIGSIRQGQTINVKAIAIPFADDTAYDARISQLKVSTPAPGVYFAHLQIERPWRMAAYGKGTKPTPKPPGAGTPSTDATVIDQWTFTDGMLCDTHGTHEVINGGVFQGWNSAGYAFNGGIQTDSIGLNGAAHYIPVSGSTAHRFSANVTNTGGETGTFSMSVAWFNAAGANLGVETVASGEGIIGGSATSPSTAAKLYWEIYRNPDGSPSNNMRVDDVLITLDDATEGSGGDGHEDLVGSDPNTYAQWPHAHHVYRDRAPLPTDDEGAGYRVELGTKWTDTNDGRTWIITDDSDDAAEWLLISGAEATSVAASEVTYDNTASGLSAEDVQAAIDEVLGLIPDPWNDPIVADLSNPPTQTELETAIGENADTNAGQFWPVTDSSNNYTYVVTSDGTRYLYSPFIRAIGTPSGGVGDPGGADLADTQKTLSASPFGGWEQSKVVARAYNGETVYTYIRGDNGDIGVLARKHSDGSTTSALIGAAYEVDDHASPDVLVRESDRRVIVVSSKHNGTGITQKVSNDGGTSLQAIIASGFTHTLLRSQIGEFSYTYPNIVQLTGETNDPLYLFFRGDGGGVGHASQAWHWSKSTNGGGSGVTPTWSVGEVYLQFAGRAPYPIMRRTSSTRIDFLIATEHWATETDMRIVHGYYDGSTQTWHKTDGTAVTLPISSVTTLTNVVTLTAGRAQDVILSGGNPWAVYIDRVATGDFRYMFSRWNGSAWTTPVQISADAEYASTSANSTGGITFDKGNPNRVYYSKVVSGVMEMFTAVTADSGATWTETAITSGSAADQFHPITPYDAEAELSVLWLNGDRNSFTDWLAGTEGY